MKILGIGCALILAAGVSADTIVYNNIVGNPPTNTGPGVQLSSSPSLFDSFTSNITGTLTDISVVMSGIGNDGDFSLMLYADNSGTPDTTTGTTLATFINQDTAGAPVLFSCGDGTSCTLSATPTLTANTRYWIGVSGTPDPNGLVMSWVQASPGVTDGEFNDNAGTINSNGPNAPPFLLEVSGTPSGVPEPTALISLMVGLAGLSFDRLRRARG
ncbi:MAG TPA: choice-of-anchor R domain-containing protein [Bryobacteraceae bacterium]|nr:choice-of-anchor R domain-containing protein [Bryobacteraceae bacterium]